MKKAFLLPSVIVLTIALHAQTKTVKPTVKPKTTAGAASAVLLRTNTDSLSYAFGISLGQYMKSQGIKALNFPMLNKAIDQTINNQPTVFDMSVANQCIASVAEKKGRQIAISEKENGRLFLEKNKVRAGVTETASGLQYEVLVKGTGPIPTREDTVIAHYKGSLLNGKEFDNSYSRGEPLTIPVARVVPGWTEALTMMPVGSKWKLYIPSDIGYGDSGAGQDIPGGATLVFEIELLGIANKK